MVLTAATAEQVQSVFDVLKSVATGMFGFIGEIVNTVLEYPLLIIPVGISLAYSAISIWKRLS